MKKPWVSPVRSVVVRVPRLDEARLFYEEAFGLTCFAEAEIDAPAVRELWGIDGEALRVAQLGQPGESWGMIELIQSSGVDRLFPPRSSQPEELGLFTLNFLTTDLDRAMQRLASRGVSFVSPPQTYETRPGRIIHEVVAQAPDGQRWTLLQVGGKIDTERHPLGQAIATVGTMVSSLEEARVFYAGILGLSVALELEGKGEPFSTLLDVPPEAEMRLILFTSDEAWVGKIEALQLKRPEGDHRSTGDFSLARAGSYRMMSFLVSGLDELIVRCRQGGVRLLRGPRSIERPFLGSVRAAVIGGPGGVLLELLERSGEARSTP